MDRIARFDTIGKKTKEHTQVRTSLGAALSVASLACMAVLFVSEFVFWRSTRVENHLLVDSSQGQREFDIALDLTFHALPCRDAHVVSEDGKGVPYEETRSQISKVAVEMPRQWLAASASASAPPPGAGAPAASPSPTPVALSGCRLTGTLRVRRVAGNFHVSAPRMLANMEGRLVFTIAPEVLQSYNASHTVNHLAFGPAFPGQVNPLDGLTAAPQDVAASYQYHVKVVPTLYEPLGGRRVDSQQFSSTDFVQPFEANSGQFVHPGVWFKYDFSPIMVRLVETRRSFLQFVTSLCAILGGVFAISGLVDTIVFRAVETSKQK